MDRQFLRSTAAVGGAQMLARVLGIAFSFTVATLYAPTQFGEVRYLIALATVLAIPTIGLPRVLSRFVAQQRTNGQEAMDRYFTNNVLLLAASSILVLITAIGTSAVQHHLSLGLYILCLGIPVVNVYFEILRAVERYYALALFYIAANALQLVVVIVAAATHHAGVTLVVAAYALSCIPPLVITELIRRSPLHFKRSAVSWQVLRELSIFSTPMLIAHAAYSAWFNVDYLLVKHFDGLAAAGNYGLAKTVVLVFVLVPYATTVVVLPRFVHAQNRNGTRYLRTLLKASALTSAALFVVTMVAGRLLLRLAFHNKYPTAANALTPLSLGMAFYSVFLVLETWVISVGKPHLWTLGISAAMVTSLGSDMLLIPAFGQRGAGIGFCAGAAIGLATIACGAWLSQRRQQEPRTGSVLESTGKRPTTGVAGAAGIALLVSCLISGILPAPPIANAASPSAKEHLTPLVGRIVAATGNSLEVAADQGGQRYLVRISTRTTYWERQVLASSDDAAVGAHLLIWSQPQADGSYNAVRMYFKVYYLTGVTEGAGPGSMMVRPTTKAGLPPAPTVLLTYTPSTVVWEGQTLVSFNQIVPGMRVGVVGYIHRSATLSSRTINIYPRYIAGTIRALYDGSVDLDVAARQVTLYMIDDPPVYRGRVLISRQALVPGTSISAYGYAQADGSIRVQRIYLAQSVFRGQLGSQNGKLVLLRSGSIPLLLVIPASASMSFRHTRTVAPTELRAGSTVSVMGYPEPGSQVLVGSLVVWTWPTSIVKKGRK